MGNLVARKRQDAVVEDTTDCSATRAARLSLAPEADGVSSVGFSKADANLFRDAQTLRTVSIVIRPRSSAA